MRALLLTVTTCLLVLPAQAKYSGGSGTAQDPYQIATAADLIALGETPADYDKHFLLTADIDLDPKLPGRKVFDKAVIAPDTDSVKSDFQGTAFTGVLDGDGHTVSHLTIAGKDYLGLFGRLVGWWPPVGEIRDLEVADVNITGSGSCVGGLVGDIFGICTVGRCYSTGKVTGNGPAGGLVGTTTYDWSGVSYITQCYSTGKVTGNGSVGGLVGENAFGTVTQCYSTGAVSGTGKNVGGLVGRGGAGSGCFWDIQTSGQAKSDGGTGKTTVQMQDIQTYLGAGWDFVGETANGTSQIWQMPPGGGYPVLAILSGYVPSKLQGLGTPEDPYLISDALELGAMVYYNPAARYRLAAPIDLSGIRWGMAVIPSFAGTFDGNGLTISHLTITGGRNLGLFGGLGFGAQVKDLGVVDVNITASGGPVGGLVGENDGTMTQCYSTGVVNGNNGVGGLVGGNEGAVTDCYSIGAVSGDVDVGGLVGWNDATVTQCYSTGAVSGKDYVGGLLGFNTEGGTVTQCYSTGRATGNSLVGGLVGANYYYATVTRCYSTGAVKGLQIVGGLVGRNGDSPDDITVVAECYSTGAVSGSKDVGGLVGAKGTRNDPVTTSFWGIQTSGQGTSAGGTGKTTAEMQTAKTFLEASWDFVGETKNGTEDLWWILEGKDYPRLWWEAAKK